MVDFNAEWHRQEAKSLDGYLKKIKDAITSNRDVTSSGYVVVR